VKKLDTVATAEWLMNSLIGLNQVGLVFEIDSERMQPEFFPSMTDATTRIRGILLNRAVNAFWVGTQPAHESALYELLQALNLKRGFGAISTTNGIAKVYDLSL
jgi:hypothetical protein